MCNTDQGSRFLTAVQPLFSLWQDPPKIDSDTLGEFTKPVIIKAGESAEWKLAFSGQAPMSIQWYKDDDELLPALNVKTEASDTESKLRLLKCQRKESGEIKIKIKNEFGTKEAISKLIVLGELLRQSETVTYCTVHLTEWKEIRQRLFAYSRLWFLIWWTDKPTPPQRPVEIMESAVTSVEFKWKPPKDSGGCPVTSYVIERQQVGRNKWSKLGEIPGSSPTFRDSDVDPGRRYCYRIRAKNAEGTSDYLQTEDIPAGVLRKCGVREFD